MANWGLGGSMMGLFLNSSTRIYKIQIIYRYYIDNMVSVQCSNLFFFSFLFVYTFSNQNFFILETLGGNFSCDEEKMLVLSCCLLLSAQLSEAVTA